MYTVRLLSGTLSAQCRKTQKTDIIPRNMRFKLQRQKTFQKKRKRTKKRLKAVEKGKKSYIIL